VTCVHSYCRDSLRGTHMTLSNVNYEFCTVFCLEPHMKIKHQWRSERVCRPGYLLIRQPSIQGMSNLTTSEVRWGSVLLGKFSSRFQCLQSERKQTVLTCRDNGVFYKTGRVFHAVVSPHHTFSFVASRT